MLASTAASDDFTRRQYALFCALADEGAPAQPLSLLITRSDYMLSRGQLKQVEINTIAASFGALSTAVGELHAFTRHRLTRSVPAAAQHFFGAGDASEIGPSASRPALAAALARAHSAYVERHVAAGAPAPIVLFVVQPGERNALDQRAIEHELWRTHGVAVRRATLSELGGALCALEGGPPSHGCAAPRLFLAAESALGERDEVSVVYFRSGYSPGDYCDENAWVAREKIERALSVKCPTLGAQLAGAKKVQQVLAASGELERFVSDEESVRSLRTSFAGLWPLDISNLKGDARATAEAAVARARRAPDLFVLKPQREGGGNNIFGAELAAALSALDADGTVRAAASMTGDQLSSYILMERLFPEAYPAILVRAGETTRADAISELGVYGVFLGEGAAVPLLNASAGYLVRTKTVGTNEGGVATGYAVIDSLLLLDEV